MKTKWFVKALYVMLSTLVLITYSGFSSFAFDDKADSEEYYYKKPSQGSAANGKVVIKYKKGSKKAAQEEEKLAEQLSIAADEAAEELTKAEEKALKAEQKAAEKDAKAADKAAAKLAKAEEKAAKEAAKAAEKAAKNANLNNKGRNKNIAKEINAPEAETIEVLDIDVISLPAGMTVEDMKALAADYDEVESVEIDSDMFVSYVPNDEYYTKYQSTFRLISVPNAWDYTKGVNVNVAVLDTGINPNHPDLAGRIGSGYNFVSGNTNTLDDNGHGTRIAGIIGANGDNSIGIAGVNWKSNIMPVKVMNSSGTGSTSVIAKGIIYAVDNGADIINLSLGSTTDSVAVREALAYAYSRNVIVVAATGNDGNTNSVDYPARYDTVIGVGAYELTKKSTYSNSGAGITTCTAGSMYSTTMGGSYSAAAGTSFATAIVSGALSLARGINPALTPDDAVKLLIDSATPVAGVSGWSADFGYGALNAPLLVQSVGSAAKESSPPKLILFGDSDMTMNQFEKYEEPGYTAVDSADGDITKNVAVKGDINTDVPGKYTLTYTVANKASETSEATRTVTVLEVKPPDTTPPVLTLIGAEEIELKQNEKYREPGYSAIDDVDGDITANVVVETDLDTDVEGEYAIFYTASDAAGNVTVKIRTVTVTVDDLTPPELILFGDIDVRMIQSSEYEEPGYSAYDDKDGDLTDEVEVETELSTSIPGDHLITYTVSDKAGNMATQTRTVTIAEQAPPQIILDGGTEIELTEGYSYVEPGYSATDVLNNDLTESVVIYSTADGYVSSSYQIEYSVTDQWGYMGRATRNVNVVPFEYDLPEEPKSPDYNPPYSEFDLDDNSTGSENDLDDDFSDDGLEPDDNYFGGGDDTDVDLPGDGLYSDDDPFGGGNDLDDDPLEDGNDPDDNEYLNDPTPTETPKSEPVIVPKSETLVSIKNASYANKDAAKSHSFQVNNDGTIKLTLSGAKNDSYTLSLKYNGNTVATKSSSGGAAELTYDATQTGVYTAEVYKTSNGASSYSLTSTQDYFLTIFEDDTPMGFVDLDKDNPDTGDAGITLESLLLGVYFLCAATAAAVFMRRIIRKNSGVKR